MDRFFNKLIEKNVPEFNPIIMDGYATHQMGYIEQYLDQKIKEASISFPEGLTYDGLLEVTPAEEFKDISRLRESKIELELSSSDFYYVKLMFSYNGTPLYPKYLYLPFISPGGILTISGSEYKLSPVLTDRVISVDEDKVFTRISLNKINTFKLSHVVRINGTPESLPVLWSKLHWGKDTMHHKTKVTTLTNYMLTKYGYTKLFEKYFDYVPIVGDVDEVNPETYPASDWIIVSALGTPPRCEVNNLSYMPHNVPLA